ncbi:MAG TPA: HDIG domain-containing protein [Candidatus Enterocloster excrementigallinarum]|uniref:HDIG domain-containing protein n=1 Tax=Candidatus Enterocloster excrementigallinarum TaxID=2838558 RepID=A0A9D2PU54_9FIRM|nr:HDIG domain-containing protein [Candidatus Enterocloster excrementigallinarum]
MRLTLEKAKELLEHAREAAKDDGFIRHCICVGDTAAVIAEAIGLEEPDYARALGYVHDIGKHLNEDNVEWHDVLGFQYLLAQGIDEQDAWICMTHSYINGDYRCEAGGIPKEHPLRCEKLRAHPYNTYEEIINLCDLMCIFETMTMEKRLIDLLVRKGIHRNTHYHLVEALKLKKKFDDKLGHNLYDLFPNIQI